MWDGWTLKIKTAGGKEASCGDITGRNIPRIAGRKVTLAWSRVRQVARWLGQGSHRGEWRSQREPSWVWVSRVGGSVILGHVQDFYLPLWEPGASGVFRQVLWSDLCSKYSSHCSVESRCLGQGKKRDPQPGAAVLLSVITAQQGEGQP